MPHFLLHQECDQSTEHLCRRIYILWWPDRSKKGLNSTMSCSTIQNSAITWSSASSARSLKRQIHHEIGRSPSLQRIHLSFWCNGRDTDRKHDTACSIVTRDIPAYTVYGGNPAKKSKDRFDDELKELLRFRWWDLEPQLLTEILPLLCYPDLDRVKQTLQEGLAWTKSISLSMRSFRCHAFLCWPERMIRKILQTWSFIFSSASSKSKMFFYPK